MTETDERPRHGSPEELLTELRWIDGQLDALFARRAGVVGRLQALHAGRPLDARAGGPGAPGPSGAPMAAPASGPSGVQGLLLGTGAVLLGLAGLFFAAVAWALVGPGGRIGILVLLGLALGGGAVALRGRLSGAAGALASVSASLVATAGYAGPAIVGVDLSPTAYAGWATAVSGVLAALWVAAVAVTGIRSWSVSATLAAAVGVLTAGLTAAGLVDDVLAHTATTAVLALAVAAASATPWPRWSWTLVLTVAGGASVLSLLAWVVEVERAVPYAAALLGWAGVVLLGRRLAPSAVPTVAARTAAAGFGAGAVSLVVGTQAWGLPSLPLLVVAGLLLVAVAHLRALPVVPLAAAVGVLALGSLAVPALVGEGGSQALTLAALLVVTTATAAAGLAPRLGPDAAPRGALWWTAGAAAALAWGVALGDSALGTPVERFTVPAGLLLVAAGVGWAAAVRRTGSGWLPTAATLLPGLLVALVPGAVAALTTTWDAGWADALPRSLAYTAVGGAVAVLGARLRVAALLVAGEVVVAVCVLAHLSGAAQVVPQWLVLAGTGALLLAVGARWEWLRTRGSAAAGWVGRLR